MRAAVLCDIHGNLPALEAVIDDLDAERIDVVVVGGDVVTGPMPWETLERLAAWAVRLEFVRGNADREAVRAFDQGRVDPDAETDPVEREAAFTAARLTREQRDLLAGLPTTVALDIDGLGPVVFCHGSPRSDTEILTTATSEERLATALAGCHATTIVGGHTHRQFDRRVDARRFVNAGSVGRPYEGRPGAFWALVGNGVSLRRTEYDLPDAAARLRLSAYPDVENLLRDSLTAPADPDEVALSLEGLAARA